jgi:hypothetical protein
MMDFDKDVCLLLKVASNLSFVTIEVLGAIHKKKFWVFPIPPIGVTCPI